MLAIARLRKLEPDNLYAWLLGDDFEEWTLDRLEAAAGATYANSRMIEDVRADLELLEPFDAPPELREGADSTTNRNTLLEGFGEDLVRGAPA